MSADEETVVDCARQLILIARDLRSWGDVPLVHLTEDGIVPEPMGLTLAGELELIALRLDFEGVTKRASEETWRDG